MRKFVICFPYKIVFISAAARTSVLTSVKSHNLRCEIYTLVEILNVQSDLNLTTTMI